MAITVRKVGIAVGSLVIASLVIGLVSEPTIGVFGGVATVILGALIYADITRRDRPAAP
jgi:hypothetical protein